MSRRTRRLDYNILNSTGERVYVEEPVEDQETSNISSEADIDDIDLLVKQLSLNDKMAEVQEMKINESIQLEEISDFIEENSPDVLSSHDELDNVIERIESQRAIYRRIHKELQQKITDYEEVYGKSYIATMESIKSFIHKSKQRKRNLCNADEEKRHCEMKMHERSLKFQVDEIERMMKGIYLTLDVELDQLTDKEVKRRKEDASLLRKDLLKIGEKFEEAIKIATQFFPDYDVEHLNGRYEKLIAHKDAYIDNLKLEAEKRELDVHDTFKTSTLNIKLPKFKGYASNMDYYTFKDLFEKVHKKSTPKALLPDLLKNNFLENPALSLVQHVNNIDEIWLRLKAAYGDQKTMLAKKLSEIDTMKALYKLKDAAKIAEGLTQIINCIKDLIRLSKRHKLENQLFYGDGLEKIYLLLGDRRMTKWISIKCESDWEGEELWNKLVEYLEKEVKVFQQKSLLLKEEKKNSQRDGGKNLHAASDNSTPNTKSPTCFICSEDDHVTTNTFDGSKIVNYFACKKFAELKPVERFNLLWKKGLCFQCLYPGANKNTGRHREGKCQNQFVCQHKMHDKYIRKMHVLVCEEHKENKENEDLLKSYKQKYIDRQASELPAYAKNIKLSFHTSFDDENLNEKAIYMLQPICIDGNDFTIFYDTGCGDFVSRRDSVIKLGERAKQEFAGPVTLGGVGGIHTESKNGIYSVRLPLLNGKDATMTGVCLDEITQEFPMYPLHGKVLKDIQKSYAKSGGKINDLPRIPKTVGGKVDFMLGIKYLRYFPELIYQLPSGLSIYKSKFKNSDGSNGIIGGPHMVFTSIENQHHLCQSTTSNFVKNQLMLYQNGLQLNPDIQKLQVKDETYGIMYDNDGTGSSDVMLTRKMKLFESFETAGSEIEYRCVNCRNCSDCKSSANEMLSIKEEIEQDCIERSVKVEDGVTTATLPFIKNPTLMLEPNRYKALKVLQQQIKKLSKYAKDKEEVIQSERKLQSLGYVGYLKNLPSNIQEELSINPVQNYIPWRCIWKENSLSTPCRMVFDASQPTNSGYSLNDLLCKGRNNMNRLVEVFIRWRSHKIAFHTDVAKMYNSIKLDTKDWCYQRYLWRDELCEENPIEEKIIKTLIYGVKSSGNQSETGIRKVAEMSKIEYPLVYQIVLKDIYVDDCLSGESNEEMMLLKEQSRWILCWGEVASA